MILPLNWNRSRSDIIIGWTRRRVKVIGIQFFIATVTPPNVHKPQKMTYIRYLCFSFSELVGWHDGHMACIKMYTGTTVYTGDCNATSFPCTTFNHKLHITNHNLPSVTIIRWIWCIILSSPTLLRVMWTWGLVSTIRCPIHWHHGMAQYSATWTDGWPEVPNQFQSSFQRLLSSPRNGRS